MPFEQTFTVFNNLSGQGVTFVLAVLISYFQKVWNCLLYDHYSNRLRRTRAQLNQAAPRELPFGLSFRDILKLSLALLQHIIQQICCSMMNLVEIYVFQRVFTLRVDFWLKITASVMFRCNLFRNNKSFTPFDQMIPSESRLIQVFTCPTPKWKIWTQLPEVGSFTFVCCAILHFYSLVLMPIINQIPLTTFLRRHVRVRLSSE